MPPQQALPLNYGLVSRIPVFFPFNIREPKAPQFSFLNRTVYNICGLVIESTIPFPEVLPEMGEEPDYSFEIFSNGKAPVCRWKRHFFLTNGKPWLSVSGKDAGFHLRFFNLAHFIVDRTEKKIRCRCKPDVPLESITHLFLDMVVPLLLSRQEKLVLHASAVSVSGKIVAFLGGTGSGKSTLATSFGMAGFPVVTDDCLVLVEKDGRIHGIPFFPGMRLWPDAVSALFPAKTKLPDVAHYMDKKRLGNGEGLIRFSAKQEPLDRVYVLSGKKVARKQSGVLIRSMPPREAFMELVKHPYRLGIDMNEKLKDEFEFIGRVVDEVEVKRVTYPKDYAALGEVREKILEDRG